MPNLWFRMYSEFADDPKVQILSEAMQRRLVMLLCLRCNGKMVETFRETEIAFKWRISPADLAETKALFLEQGFIDEKWNLVNWNKRQFVSDTSTERVRKHRKQGETFHETDETQNGTVPDTDTDTDTEQKELTLLSPAAPTEPLVRPEDFGNTWNRLRGKLPRIADFTEGRRKKVQMRIKAGLTLERFSEAIENCRAKPFLSGENENGWLANFDWLIKNQENIDKAINNPYGLNQRKKTNGRVEGNAESLRIALDSLDDKNHSSVDHDQVSADCLLPSRNGKPRVPEANGRPALEGKR